MVEHVSRKLSFLDCWLTLWIFASMALGVGLVNEAFWFQRRWFSGQP